MTQHTQIYFCLRQSMDPQNIRAGGLAQILSYTSRWQNLGIHLNVVMPKDPGESPGIEELDHVLWHRFSADSRLSSGGNGHDDSLEYSLETIMKSSRDPSVAHMLMPTDFTPTGAKIIQRASEHGIASVMPVFMTPDPVKEFSRKYWSRFFGERQWIKPITGLFANSRVSSRTIYRMTGKPLSWAKVITNGVDTERFKPASGVDEKLRLRRKLGLPDDKLIVLVVGGATQRKGVDFLLDAWERAMSEHKLDAVLVFVGGDANRILVANKDRDSFAQFANHFNDRVDEVRKMSDVLLLEHQDAVEEFYRAADLFIFGSLREGLPNAVLEAMASGLAVISTPFIGFPNEGDEFGFNGQHFIKLPRDITSWSNSIIELLTDEVRRVRIGNAARRWMECNQNLDVVTAQSAEYFHGLARSIQLDVD